MKVSIIGAGHVGLVTGACLAEIGHQVVCVDVDGAKIATINSGRSPFTERGLEPLLRKHLGTRLTATTDLHQAVLETDLSFITVGTPFDGRQIDLSYVRDASRQIGLALRDKPSYHVVVMKSTVVPGTTDEIVCSVLEEVSGKQAGRDFGVGMNPEFLTEGEALKDFMEPDRIVLGGRDDRSLNAMEELYSPFSGVERVRTNTRTAEMIKYVSNCLLATMISFSNEMANLSSAIGGIDIVDVMQGLHLSKYLTRVLPGGERIVPEIVSFLGAGCGYGGSCLPKDSMALIAHAERVGVDMRVLKAVACTNQQQPRQVIARLHKHFPSLRGVRIALLGLAFRPDTDDMRESPAIPIIRQLAAEGAVIRAYDPEAMPEAKKIFTNGDLEFCAGLNEALNDAQAVVLVTRWDEFRAVPELLARNSPQTLFVDGRRMLEKASFERYEGIGL
jgi:UDPglucose 6-dehydrogenase